MKEKTIDILNAQIASFRAPSLPAEIPHGDMPGDKVNIGEGHIQKAGVIMPVLLPMVKQKAEENKAGRVVIAVHGGSGVGKSEIASLLTYYFESMGIGSYTLSGDNYPHRIPLYNDAERVRIFRAGGIRGLIKNGLYTKEIGEKVIELQKEETDADPKKTAEYPWLAVYQKEGRSALSGYLGTPNEQNFAEISEIIGQFKNGAEKIYLKRMGRTDTELWYDEVDFSEKTVLVIEWTHGNNPNIVGVDIPILLNSTPEETREHRRLRGRDGKTDSPFTTMVLEIEQKLLDSQADRAKIIVSKSGEIIRYAEYKELMAHQL